MPATATAAPVPVHCCPRCLREYNDDALMPMALRCGCVLCRACIDAASAPPATAPPATSTSTAASSIGSPTRSPARAARNASSAAAGASPPLTCEEGHAFFASECVPSRLLLRLLEDRRDFCPLHPGKHIEIWCPACAAGLCVTCHMGDDHAKRCASIQLLEITTPQAADAVQRRAQEMLVEFAAAEARVANASLPPLEAYSAEALMNRMRDLAVQARQAFDDKLFEIVSANLELALGHQIGSAYRAMEDRHQRLVMLQAATRQIQDAEAAAQRQPGAAAARLRRLQVDAEIGKPLTVLPALRMLEGIRLVVEPIWKDLPNETLHVLEADAVAVLAVTEATNDRVKIVHSDGSLIRHLGSAGHPGSGELEFAGVRGIALLGDGQTLAISEMSNHRIKLVRTDGTFIGNIGASGKPGSGETEFNEPRGVAVLGDGSTLAVCDYGNHRVKIISADGTFIRHIGETGKPGSGRLEFNKPVAVAVFGDGVTLAVTEVENHRVKIVHSDGTFVRHIGEPYRPGKTLRGLNELEFNIPLGICVLGDGVTLAVVDSENHRVKILRGDDGTFVRHIGSGVPGSRNVDFHGPCGIATLSDGATLAVTDFENQRVKIVRSDGAFVRHLGGANCRAPNPSNTVHSASKFLSPSTPRKPGRGDREFGGPWGVVCLAPFHPGSPTRSGHNRIVAVGYDAELSRTPSAAPQ